MRTGYMGPDGYEVEDDPHPLMDGDGLDDLAAAARAANDDPGALRELSPLGRRVLGRYVDAMVRPG